MYNLKLGSKSAKFPERIRRGFGSGFGSETELSPSYFVAGLLVVPASWYVRMIPGEESSHARCSASSISWIWPNRNRLSAPAFSEKLVTQQSSWSLVLRRRRILSLVVFSSMAEDAAALSHLTHLVHESTRESSFKLPHWNFPLRWFMSVSPCAKTKCGYKVQKEQESSTRNELHVPNTCFYKAPRTPQYF